MPAETHWEELAAEVRELRHPETTDSWLPHWSPVQQTLASLDRRGERRYAMVFPIRVHGFDCDNHYFSQRTFTLDISASGCRFALNTKVQRGSIVAISVVSRDAAGAPAQKALFEVMWVEKKGSSWEVGARGLDGKNLWGVSFPEEPLRVEH